MLVRPLLDVPKARLIVTLAEAGISYAEDPSNADPRFTRARLRQLMPVLAEEGLSPRCLARLARRVRRSEAAHEAVVDHAAGRILADVGPVVLRTAVGRSVHARDGRRGIFAAHDLAGPASCDAEDQSEARTAHRSFVKPLWTVPIGWATRAPIGCA